MTADVSFPTATLVAAWAAAVLYGTNVVLGGVCLYYVSRKGLRHTVNKILFLTFSIQIMLVTGHAVSLLVQILRGFIHTPALPAGQTQPDAIDAYFENESTSEHVAQEAFYAFNTIITDVFMTWRVFLAWDKKRIIALPFIVLNLATFVLASLAIRRLNVLKPDTNAQENAQENAIFAPNTQWRFLSFWLLTLITQSAGTFMIAWRKWSTPVVFSASARRSRYRPGFIFSIVIDSGALYALVVLLFLITFARKLVLGNIIGGIAGQITAIVPLSIILREWYSEYTSARLPMGPVIVADSHNIQTPRSTSFDAYVTQDHHDGMVIQVKQSTHKLVDEGPTVMNGISGDFAGSKRKYSRGVL